MSKQSSTTIAPRLVSIADAAAALGVSRSTFYLSALDTGRIRTVRVGGRRLVRLADLDEYVAELT